MNTRLRRLFAVLALTLLAAVWLGMEEHADEPVRSHPTGTAAAPRTPATSAPAVPVELPVLADYRARPGLPASGAGFATPLSFRPPPPVVVAPPPPRPQAPPLPFRFAGLIAEGDERTVVLMEGRDFHLLRTGDVLGSRYRIDHIDDRRIDLRYLPLDQRQTLDISTP